MRVAGAVLLLVALARPGSSQVVDVSPRHVVPLSFVAVAVVASSC